MPWPRFLLYNAAGAIVWATCFGFLGYVLGDNLPVLYRVLRILGIGGIVGALLLITLGFVIWRKRAGTPSPGEQER